MIRLRALAVATLVSAALVGTAGVASAAPATVGNTDGDGLTVRAAATSASASLGLVFDGRRVDISCQKQGQSITNTRGFTSDLWDFVPALGGYLADAYMSTGHDYRIPGVPDCGGGGTPQFIPVSQFQGQPNQNEDCGPTSVVSALLAAGITPRSWNASRPVDAINRARSDMGFDPGWQDPNHFGTVESDVKRALGANGVSARVVTDFATATAHVRSGRPLIMAGNTGDLPWSTGSVPHFLTVAGYQGGQYVVLDPAAAWRVHYTSSAVLLAFWDNHLGRAAVLL